MRRSDDIMVKEKSILIYRSQLDKKNNKLENEAYCSPSSIQLEIDDFGKLQSLAICLVRLPNSLMLSWRLLRTPGVAPFLASLKVGQLLYWPA